MTRIVHFGLSDLAYCGYFLHGMAGLADSYDLHLRTDLRVPDWLSAAAGGHEHMPMISVFEVTEGSTKTRFCIDTHDKASVIHPGLLDAVDVYFKASYQPEALAGLDLSDDHASRVVSLRAPYMPVAARGWNLRPRLQAAPSMGWTRRSAARRARQLRQFPSMDKVRSLRGTPKERDLLFVMMIYRQPHHRPVNEFRYEVVRQLRANRDINAMVGLVGHLDEKYAELAVDRVHPAEHLRRLAASRIGVYVVGTHDCLSFKFCEMMALGLPIVGQPVMQDVDYFNSLPGIAEQFQYNNPDDLVRAIEETLASPNVYEKTAESNRELFDSQLAPVHVAKRILSFVLDRSNGPDRGPALLT